ncbi:MAG TPA: hypothetical protein VNM92_05530 [Thermoanaerobaculia bacterium]|nr:hypothetical protein [Thermoanaerobaculia bacterium]
MVIGQLLLHDASRYEQNAALIDREVMAGLLPVHFWRSVDESTITDQLNNPLPFDRWASELRTLGVSLLHIYGEAMPVAALKQLAIPYISPTPPKKSSFGWNKARQPAALTRPWGETPIPEAVHPRFLLAPGPRASRSPIRIGTYEGSRHSIKLICEQTYLRLERFRDDLEWELFENPPDVADFASLDVWVDPAEEDDLDGMVLEALATLTPVVAARTTINSLRLDEGRAGFLVPRDPNELTHAIASALFRHDQSSEKAIHAASRRLQFSPTQRSSALLALYRRITDA